jgi:hypothetical protein
MNPRINVRSYRLCEARAWSDMYYYAALIINYKIKYEDEITIYN